MITIEPSTSKTSTKTQSDLSSLDFLEDKSTTPTFQELVENSDFAILSQKLYYEILKPWEPVFKVGQDPHYNVFDVYDTMFLKEGMVGLKNKENCRDTCTNTVSKPSVSVSSSNSSPHGHKSKESKRLGSSNKAGSTPNPAPTTDQTPLPYLSQITPNTSKEPIKKISKCNFTSRYKPNIRKMSANYKKSLNIYQNLAEIPSSFRHYVPVGSESSYQNFMNWGNSGYQAPRTAEDIRLRRVQGGFSGRVGSGKGRVGSADASKRESTGWSWIDCTSRRLGIWASGHLGF